MALIPAAVMAGGVYTVVTGRVPPPESWWNRRREGGRAGDLRALGWYHVTGGGIYGVIVAYFVAHLVIEDVPGMVVLGYIAVLVVLGRLSAVLRRRAYSAPPAADPADG